MFPLGQLVQFCKLGFQTARRLPKYRQPIRTVSKQNKFEQNTKLTIFTYDRVLGQHRSGWTASTACVNGDFSEVLNQALTFITLFTTLSNGYLGSPIDEERSEMRYVMRIAGLSESSNLWTQIAPLGRVPLGYTWSSIGFKTIICVPSRFAASGTLLGSLSSWQLVRTRLRWKWGVIVLACRPYLVWATRSLSPLKFRRALRGSWYMIRLAATNQC